MFKVNPFRSVHGDNLAAVKWPHRVVRHATQPLLLVYQRATGTGKLVFELLVPVVAVKRQECIHNLQQVDDALEHGLRLRQVHDVLRDLHAAPDDAHKGEVENVERGLRGLRPGALADDDGSDDSRHRGEAEVEGELHEVDKELVERKEPEGAPDLCEAGVQLLRLCGLARVEADGLREQPALGVRAPQLCLGRLHGGLRGRDMLRGEQRWHQGRGHNPQGDCHGEDAPAGGLLLGLGKGEAQGRNEEAHLRAHARLRLHDAAEDKLKEELHQQVGVVCNAGIWGVNAAVKISESVVRSAMPAHVQGVQVGNERAATGDHRLHGIVVSYRFHERYQGIVEHHKRCECLKLAKFVLLDHGP
mmetsp:Transcript_106332/g.300694  ORF Transcript_106332/g.300694 Transcript_106332/m.300694 type:complete len:360 (-) Transcript_106332:805-1884(-)